MRRLLPVVLLIAVSAGGPSSAVAEDAASGPRITPASLQVETLAAPGSRLELPALVVRNAGGGPIEVTMGASSDGTAAAAWASFRPASFRLEDGEARVVNARLEIPKDAPLGDHTVLLRAGTRAAGTPEGLGLGISLGVATTARFEVGWPPEVRTSAGGVPIWAYPAGVSLALVSGVLGYLAMAAWDRIEWQSPVRRKRPPQD